MRTAYIESSLIYNDIISIPGIHFIYDSVIISREHLKWFICQENCVVATIHYKKRSVIDSRKI